MSTSARVTVDGNEAAANVAYQLSDVVAIYPITPASAMGESADAWAADGRTNVWGAVPTVVELQSEAGAAGALHGALQAGALATTFTASQGLLLMLPNMFKIAGELTPAVIHVAARAVATHALSIFGDHSDVMAARSTGWAMLCSGSVQEAQDFALIAHAATLETRIPFLHFFDGFRTSHEISKIAALAPADLLAVVDERRIAAHRGRALTPDRPVLRGTAQNPDVFFQGREASNRFHDACPGIVQQVMDRFAAVTGRQYAPFEYTGVRDAERVIAIMGSGAGAVKETVQALNEHGARVGVLQVRLFRPFSTQKFLAALPRTVRAIAVLDRTKEPGAAGEPLYEEVVSALYGTRHHDELLTRPRVVGGRYGLGSKEFTPAMVKAVFDELACREPAHGFSVGIDDDVTFQSLPYDTEFSVEPPDVTRAIFYGLGSDGTVGANKNSIKIIGERTALHAQAYFVYDSKKAGSTTVSHLRFGPRPIESTYLIHEAQFIGCHQWELLGRVDVLDHAAAGATLLLNVPYDDPAQVWANLPPQMRAEIMERELQVHVINASAVAAEAGIGRRINTVLQTCFFALSGVLPRDQAVEAIKNAIRKSYATKGDEIVRRNLDAVDRTLAHLHPMQIPAEDMASEDEPAIVPGDAPGFVRDTLAPIMAGQGDTIPVSLFPVDGTFPTATSQWEKRNLADEIPVWDTRICIQCGKCAFVCPHAAIRIKTYEPDRLASAPSTFRFTDYRGAEYAGQRYTIQVAPEDCTGCRLCVEVCPARDKATGTLALEMRPQRPLRGAERENFAFFLDLPEVDRRTAKVHTVKGSQFLQPLFEFSGACVGCGETPYLKLASQLFGDRMIVANATGCSSIFGGNLPTTPWSCNSDGRGPAWCNSLFEDNAEFGYGVRIGVDARRAQARRLLAGLRFVAGEELADAILADTDTSEAGIHEQRERVVTLRRHLEEFVDGVGADAHVAQARQLLDVADYLVKKSVWIVGGDGWAYDIGFGGLDHVLASGADVNILVLDTEVYSNTGGQASKATPRGAVARFAASGKRAAKKDLALQALTYRDVYVAQVALGANDTQTVKAFLEAESYPGPSLIIAYAHCIAHGVDMTRGLDQQKRAVGCGHWPLFRHDPRAAGDRQPFTLDSRPPSLTFGTYAEAEGRYRSLSEPDAAALLAQAQRDVDARWRIYQALAAGQSR